MSPGSSGSEREAMPSDIRQELVCLSLGIGGGTMEKCETIACRNRATQMYQIAPGTNVWLYADWIEQMKKDLGREMEAHAESEKVR